MPDSLFHRAMHSDDAGRNHHPGLTQSRPVVWLGVFPEAIYVKGMFGRGRERMSGDPGRIRTLSLLIRSQLLYPVELRDRTPRDSAKARAGEVAQGKAQGITG